MKKSHKIIAFAVVLVIIIVVAVTLGIVLRKKDKSKGTVTKHPENKAYRYSKAAVATDAAVCSKIGNDILLQQGTAVDAAVAASFCTGVVNLHSTGIGGGGFMVVYNRKAKQTEVYDYRETAPGNASERMYLKNGTSSSVGGLATGIPGEVLGLYTAWKKHGKLPWAKLIDPSIKLARDGFPLPEPVAAALERRSTIRKVLADPGLRDILTINGRVKKLGEELKNTKLADTLTKIKNDPFTFYNGSLAREIVNDVQNSAGIITLNDLKTYNVSIKQPIKMNFKDFDLHTMPPPGSGAVLAMILNIMEGYSMNADDLKDTQKTVDIYQRIVESFKWAYARRALLGDPDFVPRDNITRAINQMVNKTIAAIIRRDKIKLNQTFNTSYYGGYYGKEDFGTSHLSVLAENGDAVSLTGTVNFLFGAGYRSTVNGIIYNNEMDDFSTPGKANLYGFQPTIANYIRPGKRPLSSMCPAIITDKNGDVKMIAGASGGSRIITGTAQAIINKILLNLDLGPSVANPRLHHQLLPDQVYSFIKRPMPSQILDGLNKIGHKIVNTTFFSVVQAIYKENANTIFAISDPRKKGKPAGY